MGMKRSALIFVISIAAFGYNTDQIKRLPTRGQPGANLLEVGEMSPRFVLQRIDGEDLAMEQVLRDNSLVLLNFWATWCPLCWIEMLELEKIYREHHAQGLEVLAVAVDDTEDVRTYVDLEPLSYPVLLDPDGVVARRFGVDAMPTSVLVGRDGTVLRTCQGLTFDLENQLTSFLNVN
jgi:peroxiredoxin